MTTPDNPFGHPAQQPAAGGQQPFQGQPYAAPGYGAGYGTPVVAVRNGLETAALVLGILGIEPGPTGQLCRPVATSSART